MNDNAFLQGKQNIDDARFVQHHFVPLARDYRKWNIVVYEAQRATELTIRGIMCLVGLKPKKDTSHDLEAIVKSLDNRLNKDETRVLMHTDSGIIAPLGSHISVFMSPTLISLAEGADDTYTIRASSSIVPAFRDRVTLKLKHTEGELILYLNGQPQLSYPAAKGSVDEEVSFETMSNDERTNALRDLKHIGSRLYKRRNVAFYGEVIFREQDAENAIDDMNQAIQLSRLFYIIRG